ncbi:MAG: peptidoglycan-binding protein [Proteobacteria bacterium]|nr:peptidoglycan-binding protein [Pseudomonadota bacterium]MBU1585736.1 peptidoglycan-binding protein [Pseudomonadota bacterium]MBU2454219.1 peptidoglycan-binding protein [Pseudomonadota bacterium]MBU2629939.1 peptidoglycan-binding protein [Pseudomonadota bacterium]
MHDLRFIRWMMPALFAAVMTIFIALSGPATAQGNEAENNYQRFLSIYRQDNPGSQELKNALNFLETANLLSPDTYKYVFSLGALNNTLKNWEKATEWLEKARLMAVTDEQRGAIQSELGYCQTQLAKLRVENWGSKGVSISFIMKKGTVEMEKDAIMNLPKRLPVIDAGASAGPMEAVIRQSLHNLRIDVFEKAPFLIIGLEDPVSPVKHYERGVKDFYAYFMKEYFDTPPQRLLVIMISPQPFALVDATHQLYPEVGLPVYAPFLGYYNPSDNLIMATGGRTGYGTLLHEMVHAMIKADFPEAPDWLNEGLASLYERTQWNSGRLTALPNWRMDGMREEKVSSLIELTQKAQDLGLHSTQIREIRLLLLCLDQRQKVDDLYKMVKQQGPDFDLKKAVTELGLDEQGWRGFLKTTFQDYFAEIAQDKGALSNPDEVQFLQSALNQIMAATLKVDGVWGPSTREKLMAFQRRFKLEPDGMPGPKTMAELKRQYTLERLTAFEKSP